MNRISQLQLTDASSWSGLTTENHLGFMHMQNRVLTSPLIDDLLDVNLGLDFDRFMDNFPTFEIEKDVEFEWLLSGPDIKNYPLVTYYDESGNTPAKAGISGSRFFMEFPVRMFEATDVIATDSKEVYQLQVKAEPKAKGVNFVYEVELMGGDPTLFVPASELVAGKRYAKLYSPVEQTLSNRGGTVQHSGYFKMANRCSSIRMNYDVPGNMIAAGENKPMGALFRNKDTGKLEATWLGKLDYDFLSQFKRQKAYLGMYALMNKTSQGTYNNKGETGYEIKMGAGLYQQISPSNVHYLNWTLDILEDVLMSLSVGKLPHDQRKFVIGTGEYGWKKFHKLVEAKGMAFSANNAGGRVSGTGNNLRFGGQFTKIGFVNGIEVELMKLPFLDDPTLNTEMHPDGGLVSSYEMLIMDIGTTNGTPNIQKVTVKGNEEMYAYVPGLRDPFTPYNKVNTPKMTATLKDGYSVGKMFIGGIKVNNPTKIARILPNFR